MGPRVVHVGGRRRWCGVQRAAEMQAKENPAALDSRGQHEMVSWFSSADTPTFLWVGWWAQGPEAGEPS